MAQERVAGAALLIVVALTSLLAIGAAAIPAAPPETTDEVAKVYQWIVIVAIPVLTGAIVFLWRALAAANKTIVDEVKAAQPAREEQLRSNQAVTLAMNEAVGAIREMRADVRFCPQRREREEESAAGVDRG